MFNIRLDRPEAAFKPGDVISGQVTWEKDSEGASDELEKVEVRMIWYTAGKGERDFDIVANWPVVSPQKSGNTQFKFVAPTRPYSFSGKLVSLIWAIEVIGFPNLEAEQVEFVMSHTATEIVLDGG